MSRAHTIFKILIKFINYIIPKKREKVMFASFPDFADNARALYEYMIQNDQFTGWKYVWVVSSITNLSNSDNTLFIKKPEGYWHIDYLRYLYHIITSKYLFSTHSFFIEALPSRQYSVLLWHGTMLKRICAMNEREKEMGGKPQYRYFVSPSDYYVQFFSKSFLCKEDHVLVSGYPRNDFLLEKTDVFNKLGINYTLFDKVIVYMPTFRTPVGGGYSDSTDDRQMCIDLENENSMHELSNYLEERNTLLIIKWHPSDIRQSISLRFHNIIAIKNQELEKIDAQVYHLLYFADALITDYSSVFCDYLILDRPIAFDISDMDSYADKRGFVFDNPLDFMPGVKLQNNADFIDFCDDISKGVDRSREERNRLRLVYNDYNDGNNCKRLCDYLMGDKNNRNHYGM